MIQYHRTRWFGFAYLLRIQGSLLPRCIPWLIVSGTLSVLLTTRVLEPIFGWDLATFFEETYSLNLFGLVFGYMAVTRLNTCCIYARASTLD